MTVSECEWSSKPQREQLTAPIKPSSHYPPLAAQEYEEAISLIAARVASDDLDAREHLAAVAAAGAASTAVAMGAAGVADAEEEKVGASPLPPPTATLLATSACASAYIASCNSAP